VAADPAHNELHFEDETHVATTPDLGWAWHRVGRQPTGPAAGPTRRLPGFGRVEALGRGRVAVVQARQDSAGFARYLAALAARHRATGRRMILVRDNGPCPVSRATKAALAERAAWLEVSWLARYSPQLNPTEREWRVLKRDHRSHVARGLREFVDELVAGLGRLGGERCDIVDEVPPWWLDGHRKEPTGRPPGRPKGAKDSRPRRTKLPAPT
jgi:transposase